MGLGDEPTLVTPPAVVHAVANQSDSLGTTPIAIDPAVVPAAGILDGIFGPQPKRAKKESEDGRKATALPPPDPSTVDWSGVPTHQPKRAATEPETDAPLMDSRRTSSAATGSGVAKPSTSATRPSVPRLGTSQSDPPLPPAPVPSSTANLRRPADSVPTIPGRSASAAIRPNTDIPPIPVSPGNRIPNVVTAPGTVERSTIDSELSDSRSTRRSGRKPVEALNAEALQANPEEPVAAVPTESASLTELTPVPSVPRRELMPLESGLPKLGSPAPSGTASSPKDTTSSGNQSLADLWNSSAPTSKAPTTPAPTSPAPAPAASEPAKVAALPSLPAATAPAKQPAAAPEMAQQAPAVPAAPATIDSGADTGVPSLPATPVVADATPTGPSPASERALRDQLTASSSSTGKTRTELTARQLGDSEIPGIRVVTEGPSEIMIRELVQYEVRVENRGAKEAKGLIVRSSLPPWAEIEGQNASFGTVKLENSNGVSQLQWTVDKLPAGVVERLFVRVRAVRAGRFEVATDWTIMPQRHVASVQVREPKLAVTIDGPSEIIYGRSEKYQVRVLNPGDGDATNVVFTLAPDSKSPQSQKIGNIPAGKEAQFEIELTARELGELQIGGRATADRDVKSDGVKTVKIASANMVAELTGPPLKYQNTNANYRLVVSNTGKAVCEGVQAELRLPAGVNYVSGIEGASVQGDRLTWKIDALQPGAAREYDLICQMQRTGNMLLSFNCNGSAAGRASVTIETQVEAIADLVLTVSDPVAPAPVGSDVAYEINLSNRGTKAAEQVRVVAQFSNGIEPVKVEGQTGEVLTGQVLFSPIARLEPGASVKLKVFAKADVAGDHRFRTEARYGETSLVAEEATIFMAMPSERISRRSTDQKQ